MSEDLFLKIISREIPADIVYEDDDVLAFTDVNPQAPLHVLIIPKIRIRTINDMQVQDTELFGKLFLAAQKIAADWLQGGYELQCCSRTDCISYPLAFTWWEAI